MPRLVSFVIGLAASGRSAGPTKTFITPLTGAMKLICLPSGLNFTEVLSGLPKNSLRSIKPDALPTGVGSRSAPLAAEPKTTHANDNRLHQFNIAHPREE